MSFGAPRWDLLCMHNGRAVPINRISIATRRAKCVFCAVAKTTPFEPLQPASTCKHKQAHLSRLDGPLGRHKTLRACALRSIVANCVPNAHIAVRRFERDARARRVFHAVAVDAKGARHATQEGTGVSADIVGYTHPMATGNCD